MIIKKPTEQDLKNWQSIWLEHKDKMTPNRKSGAELLSYLQSKYILTEIYDKNAVDAIIGNVTMNACHSEKLPKGTAPIPRTFFLENSGCGEVFYKDENSDPVEI